MQRYAIEIVYSEKAGGFIAVAPELPGCSALGDTEEEALMEIKNAIKIWLSYAEVEKREIPQPMGSGLLDEIFKKAAGFKAKQEKKTCAN